MIPQIDVLGMGIPTYLLVISLVYCLGIYYLFNRLKRYDLSPMLATDLILVAMIFGFLGARIFYVIYQEPKFYFSDPSQIFMFWNGGFIFFGGFLLAFAASYIFLKFKSENIGLWMDAIAPVLALGYGLGRVACFLNGCCYGHVCALPWGIQFPGLYGLRHPTQLYAVIYELIVWLILLFLERKVVFKIKNFGLLFYSWLVMHGIGRIFMEWFRDDPRGDRILGLSISTWISIGLIIFALKIIYKNLKKTYKVGRTISN